MKKLNINQIQGKAFKNKNNPHTPLKNRGSLNNFGGLWAVLARQVVEEIAVRKRPRAQHYLPPCRRAQSTALHLLWTNRPRLADENAHSSLRNSPSQRSPFLFTPSHGGLLHLLCSFPLLIWYFCIVFVICLYYFIILLNILLPILFLFNKSSNMEPENRVVTCY